MSYPAGSPYWQSPMAALYRGDAASVLKSLPAESVDMAVTSPPFWGLRDYKVADQIGLEKTPEEWLERILAVFREVRRVLRPWGTLWCEIGDSYAGSGSPGGDFRNGKGGDDYLRPYNRKGKELKPLDLVGIPFRLALALQQDGWICRSTIIWDKPSSMPESIRGWRWEKCRVKVGQVPAKQDSYIGCDALQEGRHGIGTPQWADCPGCPKCIPNGGLVLRKGSWRPTEAHSYILMLAKSASYFGNGEAAREGVTGNTHSRGPRPHVSPKTAIPGSGIASNSSYDLAKWDMVSSRNARSVWRITPEPSSLPHFAQYPTALPEKCILAGTSEWGNCPRCGMPWVPVVETKERILQREPAHVPGNTPTKVDSTGWEPPEPTVTAWKASCACGLLERVPAVVLDPFVGTGTTCVAAQQLGRKSIGIDLSEAYLKLSVKRLEGVSLPLGNQKDG